MNVIDLFNKINTKCYPDSNIGKWYYKAGRFLTRKLSDPILTGILKLSRHSIKLGEKIDVIISLTSFPGRINNVWKTIECLKRQSCSPMKIILWLSDAEFPNHMEDLPQNIKRLQDDVFRIEFVRDNLKPHKKYFYAFKKYPDKLIVTVDDDVFYDSKMLERLYYTYKSYPNCIICNRGLLISKNGSYSTWKSLKKECGPNSQICPTGVGGVLYPPHCCNDDIFKDSVIRKTCLNADDLWLSFMSRLKGTQIVKTEGFIEPIVVNSSQKEALCKTNNGTENKNDLQIMQISNYASKTYGVDFFIRV